MSECGARGECFGCVCTDRESSYLCPLVLLLMLMLHRRTESNEGGSWIDPSGSSRRTVVVVALS